MKLLKIQPGSPSASVRELLYNNVIGTPGKSLVYQHQRVKAKLSWMKNPVFVSVEIGGKAVGTCCFALRETICNGETVKSGYIRYFSFKECFRSVGDPMKRMTKTSLLKEEIKLLLAGQELSPEIKHLYAYVDPGNLRSKRIIDSYDFQEVGRFSTVYFSRFFPICRDGYHILQGNELNQFKEKLMENYRNHLFYSNENIGFEDGAIGMIQDGELLAALQANTEHWKVFQIPGAQWMLKLLSGIPLLNRLFGQDFKFMSVEGVYLKPGFENLITPLLESALKLKNRNTAILCLDKKDPVYNLIKSQNQGFIKYISSEKEMAVVARGTENENVSYESSPVYVSGFDNM